MGATLHVCSILSALIVIVAAQTPFEGYHTIIHSSFPIDAPLQLDAGEHLVLPIVKPSPDAPQAKDDDKRKLRVINISQKSNNTTKDDVRELKSIPTESVFPDISNRTALLIQKLAELNQSRRTVKTEEKLSPELLARSPSIDYGLPKLTQTANSAAFASLSAYQTPRLAISEPLKTTGIQPRTQQTKIPSAEELLEKGYVLSDTYSLNAPPESEFPFPLARYRLPPNNADLVLRPPGPLYGQFRPEKESVRGKSDELPGFKSRLTTGDVDQSHDTTTQFPLPLEIQYNFLPKTNLAGFSLDKEFLSRFLMPGLAYAVPHLASETTDARNAPTIFENRQGTRAEINSSFASLRSGIIGGGIRSVKEDASSHTNYTPSSISKEEEKAFISHFQDGGDGIKSRLVSSGTVNEKDKMPTQTNVQPSSYLKYKAPLNAESGDSFASKFEHITNRNNALNHEQFAIYYRTPSSGSRPAIKEPSNISEKVNSTKIGGLSKQLIEEYFKKSPRFDEIDTRLNPSKSAPSDELLNTRHKTPNSPMRSYKVPDIPIVAPQTSTSRLSSQLTHRHDGGSRTYDATDVPIRSPQINTASSGSIAPNNQFPLTHAPLIKNEVQTEAQISADFGVPRTYDVPDLQTNLAHSSSIDRPNQVPLRHTALIKNEIHPEAQFSADLDASQHIRASQHNPVSSVHHNNQLPLIHIPLVKNEVEAEAQFSQNFGIPRTNGVTDVPGFPSQTNPAHLNSIDRYNQPSLTHTPFVDNEVEAEAQFAADLDALRSYGVPDALIFPSQTNSDKSIDSNNQISFTDTSLIKKEAEHEAQVSAELDALRTYGVPDVPIFAPQTNSGSLSSIDRNNQLPLTSTPTIKHEAAAEPSVPKIYSKTTDHAYPSTSVFDKSNTAESDAHNIKIPFLVYGPPDASSHHFGLPSSASTDNSVISKVSAFTTGAISPQYGLPKLHSISNFEPQTHQAIPKPSVEYGAPPTTKYGPPSSNKFPDIDIRKLPKVVRKPNAQITISGPDDEYVARNTVPPSTEYGSPAISIQYSLPKVYNIPNFEPQTHQTVHKPSVEYGTPPRTKYGLPSSNKFPDIDIRKLPKVERKPNTQIIISRPHGEYLAPIAVPPSAIYGSPLPNFYQNVDIRSPSLRFRQLKENFSRTYEFGVPVLQVPRTRPLTSYEAPIY